MVDLFLQRYLTRLARGRKANSRLGFTGSKLNFEVKSFSLRRMKVSGFNIVLFKCAELFEGCPSLAYTIAFKVG